MSLVNVLSSSSFFASDRVIFLGLGWAGANSRFFFGAIAVAAHCEGRGDCYVNG